MQERKETNRDRVTKVKGERGRGLKKEMLLRVLRPQAYKLFGLICKLLIQRPIKEYIKSIRFCKYILKVS